MSRNNLFWNILTPVVFMVNIYIIKTYLLDDMSCVYLMCANFIFVLWRIWCVGGLSPYMLFMTTFSFLFIGGHFWGVLFNPQLSLRVGSFLDPQPTSNSEWRETLIYLILFLYMTLLGYLYIYGRSGNRTNIQKGLLEQVTFPSKQFNRALTVIWVFLSSLVFFTDAMALLIVLRGGYGELYMAQGDTYSASSIVVVFEYFFFAMAMTYGNARNRHLYIILFVADGLFKILGGGRGAFGSILMFFIWYYSLNHKVNLRILAIGGTLALAILLVLSNQSKRSVDSGNSFTTVNEVAALFFYAQGESLSTFEASRGIKKYPWLCYVQSFVPGTSFLYYHLASDGHALRNNDTSFSLYLSSCLNPERFALGDGAGWTYMSDLYLFSGRTYWGFALLALLSGIIIGWLEIKSHTNNLCKVVLFAIFLRLMILPRTGLNYIIPLIVYILVLFGIFKQIYNLKVRNSV